MTATLKRTLFAYALLVSSMAPTVGSIRYHARRSSAEHCVFDLPETEPAGANLDTMGFINRAYGDDKMLAHLGNASVTDRASKHGRRGPRKCQAADADGNCAIAICGEDTYGEITQAAAVTLLADPNVHFPRGGVFFDLGSGLGKFVADAAILVGARRAVGVELSSMRFNMACAALGKIEGLLRKSEGIPNTRRVEMHRGDMLQTQLEELRHADVVYIASLCFRPALMKEVQNMLVRRLRMGTRVVSLRRFPQPDTSEQAPAMLSFVAKLRAVMDWNDPADPNPVFVYQVKQRNA